MLAGLKIINEAHFDSTWITKVDYKDDYEINNYEINNEQKYNENENEQIEYDGMDANELANILDEQIIPPTECEGPIINPQTEHDYKTNKN